LKFKDYHIAIFRQNKKKSPGKTLFGVKLLRISDYKQKTQGNGKEYIVWDPTIKIAVYYSKSIVHNKLKINNNH